MKVKDIIAGLQTCDPEAEGYYGMFEGFLDKDLKRTSDTTHREYHEVYGITFEEKTVYQWCHRTNKFIEYTGVIFEVD